MKHRISIEIAVDDQGREKTRERISKKQEQSRLDGDLRILLSGSGYSYTVLSSEIRIDRLYC
jgi:hypothetical protein